MSTLIKFLIHLNRKNQKLIIQNLNKTILMIVKKNIYIFFGLYKQKCIVFIAFLKFG